MGSTRQTTFNSGVLGTSAEGVGMQGNGLTDVAGSGTIGVRGEGQVAYFNGTSVALSLHDYNALLDNGPPGYLIEAYGTDNAGDDICFVPVLTLDNFGDETIAGSLTASAHVVSLT